MKSGRIPEVLYQFDKIISPSELKQLLQEFNDIYQINKFNIQILDESNYIVFYENDITHINVAFSAICNNVKWNVDFNNYLYRIKEILWIFLSSYFVSSSYGIYKYIVRAET